MSPASKAPSLLALGALAAGLLGCGTGLTQYSPKLVAQDELWLRYDNRFEIYAGDRLISEGYRHTGLASFVRCVPEAHRHAEASASDGATGYGLSIAAGASAIVGLGGLSGLAFYDKNTTTMAALLGGGIGLEVAGRVMAIRARGYKASANGHAVDALNHYNDALGSQGGSCDRPLPAAAPAAPAPAEPPPVSILPPPLAPRVNALR